ncbi:MAG: hypothetical protein HW411_1078 [Gammaproteobacteria bacterium]|nr:hypothetical protein [Gammaproteobacteria bacterium]
MHFYKRDLDAEKGITQGNAGMRKCPRIDDDKINLVFIGCLDLIHEFMLGVALKTARRLIRSLISSSVVVP